MSQNTLIIMLQDKKPETDKELIMCIADWLHKFGRRLDINCTIDVIDAADMLYKSIGQIEQV